MADLRKHHPSGFPGRSQRLLPSSASWGLPPSLWGLLWDSPPPTNRGVVICRHRTPSRGARRTHLLTQ